MTRRLIPVKKFFYVVKILIALGLLIFLGSLIDFRKRSHSLTARLRPQNALEISKYERMIREDELRIVAGLGNNGAAASLAGKDEELGKASEKKLAMNVYLSDRIPYNRTLKDARNPACSSITYDAELPSVSVIVIFHNEPYSVVVRTIWSVLNSVKRENPWFQNANHYDRATGRNMNLGYPDQDPSSPYLYLKEIILVDDNSTLPELGGKLDYYVESRLPKELIKIVRLDKRNGLIKARLRGARLARSDTLIFLDAHCEVFVDWLRPLLQRLKEKRDSALTPIIDVIDQTTFEIQASQTFQIGGFSFSGHFTWVNVPEREKLRRGSDVAPTWSPTMAGGLFAINRNYFWEIGAYDEQMTGWGGENLEMSFRIWQCGGTLETVPCSRVGHVFRQFHPYGMPADSDTHGINTARMAEVWMDEYAELFYLHRPDLKNNPKIGDVTHRKVLREKLHCKSFQWYLENVFQEKFVPVRDDKAFGRFRNPKSNLCLDNLQKEDNLSPLGVYQCHPNLSTSQFFSLTKNGQLRTEDLCAEIQFFRGKNDLETEDMSKNVVMTECHGKKRLSWQEWELTSAGQIRHARSKLCLDTVGLSSGQSVMANSCRPGRPTQIWQADYDSDHTMDNIGADTIDNLQKIIDSRKIIRVRRSAPKPIKRKKRVNKFILRIQRIASDGNDEHLEMDIYCKHRKLFPNNTFVKDLVHIFNENNITVINNGRIFHKHRIFGSNMKSQLDAMDKPREELYKRYSNPKPPMQEKYGDSNGFTGVEDIKINIGVGEKKHEMMRMKNIQSERSHDAGMSRQDKQEKRERVSDSMPKSKDVEMILQPLLTFSLKQQDKDKRPEDVRDKKGANPMDYVSKDPQNIDMLVKTNLTFIVTEDSNRKDAKKAKKVSLAATRSAEDYSLDTEIKTKIRNEEEDESSDAESFEEA